MRLSGLVCVLVLVTAILTAKGFAGNPEVRGQVSGWLTIDDREAVDASAGVRYIPEVTFESVIGEDQILTAFASINCYAAVDVLDGGDYEDDSDVDPYRLWARFSTSQFEARVGLQKINFGSASLLRPLMWFDRIDSRDPLGLTDGVYGLLARYYFVNNANLWLWGLYGNKDPRGWDLLGSDDETPEFGGRIQIPVWTGEVALSGHHRRVDIGAAFGLDIPGLKYTASEDRVGFDAKFDVGVGAWVEASFVHLEAAPELLRWQRAITVGTDYTFGVGNGLTALAEHFVFETAADAFGSGTGIDVSAVSVGYPIGLVHSVSAIVYYDWDDDAWYRLADWRMTYDNWSFHVMGYMNPDQGDIYGMSTSGAAYAGNGLQFMAVFNH